MPAVIVVGAGPAGCEAAHACASAGLDTLLITNSLDTVCQSYDPLVDLAACAGPFMRALAGDLGAERVSARELHRAAKRRLENLGPLHLLQSGVAELLTTDGGVRGVLTWEGLEHEAPLVALCSGSFMRARLEVGAVVEQVGRPGEVAYDDLHDAMVARGFHFREEKIDLTAAPEAGRPAATAFSTQVLESSELDGFWLRRLAGLAAAGFVAAGYLTFAGAANAGKELGKALVAAARA